MLNRPLQYSYVFSYLGGVSSKVPKLYRPFSGVTIPFVSQERREFNSSNLTVIFVFVTLKTCQKIGFPKQVVGNFTCGFLGPKSFWDFKKRAPGLKASEKNASEAGVDLIMIHTSFLF